MPGRTIDASCAAGLRRVSRFIEKPDLRTACALLEAGGLWNTLVMTFHARTFFDLAHRLAPALCAGFERIARAIGTPREREVVEEVYRTLEPVNLSKDFLEAIASLDPARLLTLPVHAVHWSDWGAGRRIVQTLHALESEGGAQPVAAAASGDLRPTHHVHA